MRFTEQEMVFFNSITKGDSVLGIPLHFCSEKDEDTEIKKTIQGLVKKGVLKSETELSREGALPAKALEAYKESRRHRIINYLHIALLEKQEAVVIIPLKNRTYELLRLPRTAVFYLLLEQYPVLRKAASAVDGTPKLVEVDTFLQKVKDYDGTIMAGEFQDSTVEAERVYFWKEEQIYRYDFFTRMEKKVTAVQARRELMKLLQIQEEVERYGR